MTWRLAPVIAAALLAVAAAQRTAPQPAVARPPAASLDEAERELSREAARSLMLADEREFFTRAAEHAWRYGKQYYRASTGIVAPVPFYDYATVWDLGSSLAMLYAARELGFIEASDYKARMRIALRTLSRLALFDGKGFNKAYQVTTGAMVDRHQKPSSTGFGWSVTDIGRLLVWLRIVTNRDPEFEPAAAAVVGKLDLKHLVRDGYMWGEDLGPTGAHRVYHEGQLGYEQYAAQGFALWGARPDLALKIEENAIPIDVMGQTVAADARQRDRLTSEPFILSGLEFGWSPEMGRLARGVLEAQAERAKRTGIITMVSEDALPEPPHFFYYYCVFANARQFSIDVQDARAVVDGPRWMSTKAAFGWHALTPSAYTRRALKAVAPARGAQGWASGVYENSTRSTGTLNVNTAAVVMSAALYALRGEPMLERKGGHDQQSALR